MNVKLSGYENGKFRAPVRVCAISKGRHTYSLVAQGKLAGKTTFLSFFAARFKGAGSYHFDAASERADSNRLRNGMPPHSSGGTVEIVGLGASFVADPKPGSVITVHPGLASGTIDFHLEAAYNGYRLNVVGGWSCAPKHVP